VAGVRSRRVFFALWPDDEATGHLAALGHSLAPRGSRLTRPASLHLMLAFIGSVTSEQVGQLDALAAGIRAAPFDLSLDRLGFWPQGGVLWAGCRQTPAPLRRLVEHLAVALREAGIAGAQRAGATLTPHVTLARRVRCPSLPRLETPVGWRVGEFALVESHLHPAAASYDTLSVYPLTATAPESN